MRPREKRFIEGVLAGKTQDQAALDAGWGKGNRSSARRIATQLVRHPKYVHVQAELERRRAELARRLEDNTDITLERVVLEIGRLAFSDIRSVLEVRDGQVMLRDSADWTQDAAAAVAEVSETQHGLRVKMHDKPGNLDKLMRYLGGYTDRVELSGGDGGPIQIVFPQAGAAASRRQEVLDAETD